MKYCLRSCLLLLLSFSTSLFADDSANYWQCTARDGVHRQWTAASVYQKVALNYAYAGCKKLSALPSTCRAVKGNCEQFINGVSRRPMWECTALDQMAIAWTSDAYSDKYDAAFAARDLCRKHSDVPGTCYIHLITCANENEFSR